METKVTAKYKQFGQMIATLDRATILYAKKCQLFNPAIPETEDDLLAYRDSLIQRLEYCTDAFWKLLKIYLEDIEGITLESTGPKSVGRRAAQMHIITEQESAELILILEERNKTSHMYRQEIADEIAKNTPRALMLMQNIFQRTAVKINLIS
jgi:nucleotidyltransferase substrate binding protein (TIGR01987 family)